MNPRLPFSAALAASLCSGPIALVPSAVAAEIEGLPKAGPAHHLEITPAQEKTLPNGLRIIVQQRPALPLLTAELLIKSGAETDPPKLAGLAHFTANLLKRGTTTRSAPQIAQDTEALGAKIDTEASWDAASVKLTTLSANAEPALAIVSDLVRHPAFAKDEIERQRREMLDDLRLSLEEPGTVARFAIRRAVLGTSSYAHADTGTPASLSHLTRKDIVTLHGQAYRPGNAILVLTGSLKAEEAFALAEKTFGDWADSAPTSKTAESMLTASPTPPMGGRVILIDMPTAGQAAVYVAARGILRTADDWFAGKVTNALLGGGYSSRLNLEVRLKRGLSYGAASGLSTYRDNGIFSAGAQTKNESAAEVVKVMQGEIQRLLTESAPDQYLKGREAVLTGAFARDLETNDNYSDRLADLALYALPLDSLGHYIESVEHVTPVALQTFAQHHFAAENFTVVVAGQAKVVENPLRELYPKLEVIPAAKLDLDAPTLRPPALTVHH